MGKAIGLIEVVGKIAAVEVMDAAVKSADVVLVGLENSRGDGRMTVKLEGEISAVEAATEAATEAVKKLGKDIYAKKVIGRPSDELKSMLSETMGVWNGTSWYPDKSEVGQVEEMLVEETIVEALEATCNICGDPQCKRVKGEVRKKCIHYDEMN